MKYSIILLLKKVNEKLHNVINFKSLIYHKNPSVNVNDFIDAVMLFDEKSLMMTQKKIKWNLNQKWVITGRKLITGGRKLDKQNSEIKHTMNLYDAQEELIKFFEEYSTLIHNSRYDAADGKGLKILTLKQMF